MASGDLTLHQIRLANVSCYLLYRPGEALLIDCGNVGSEGKILEEMTRLDLQPGMLKLLVLTHAHFDHAGSAQRLKKLTGCKIMIHQSEAERIRAGFTGLPPGTRWKAKLLVGVGRVIARRLGKYPPAEPDLLVEQMADLREYGFEGKVLHTPGHTPGSMVVLLERGELIAGDTLFGWERKQHFPPFAEDLPRLVESWKRIREWDVKTIYPAHGRSIPWDSFLAEFDLVVKKLLKK